MTLGAPWMLLALLAVPVAIVAHVRMTRKRARRADELAAAGLVPTSPPRRARWRRHVPFALFVAALALVCFGLARPTVSFALPRLEGTVILAFDVSNSMRATDIEPTRLDAAKTAASAFVEQQPDTVDIGVVAFGESGLTVLPPTDVEEDVLAAIRRLSTSGGTSLGQGLFTSLGAIAGKPLTVDPERLDGEGTPVEIGYYGSAAIVLLSDGENTSDPDPLDVAEVAGTAGVAVHAIGLGSPEGTVIEVDGFNVATALDEELLTEIAEVTDGTYATAADAGTLTDVYSSIDLELERVEEPREVTALFAAAGALLLAVGAIASLAWFGRVI